MPNTYKIGQILTVTEDVVLQHALSEETTFVTKGTKVIIGADRLAHYKMVLYSLLVQKVL